MRHISAKEVRENLSMAEAIVALEQAFQDLSSGKAIVPDRLPMHTDTASEYLFMPAYYPSGGITTIKSVSINATNTERGLPYIHAVILVFDHDSGQPIATIDGGEVTAIRTAAASGLATKLFANPDSRIAAIFCVSDIRSGGSREIK
jgi:ornithine cyclodeaminase/alanine dehydrogenase-like protein (mu-crystallin family)